jgi:ABC-type sugar transport system ATPase subunit
MSDRILVLFQGRLVADIPRADASPDRVLHFMMTGKDIEL